MTAVISPPMFLQFFDPNNSGAVAQGFKLFTYIAGTSTKQNTWTDSTQGTQNDNPILLDANGVAAKSSGSGVWLDPTLLYKFVWAPANDTDPPSSPIRSIDNIAGPITIATLTQALIGFVLYPRTTSETATAVTPVSYPYPPDGVNTLNVFRFYTSAQIASVLLGNLAQDVSVPLQAAINFLEGRITAGTGGKPYSNGGTLYLPGGVHYCGTTSIRVGGNVRLVGNQYEGTQMQWAAGFSGNCLTLGPDQSGFYGYSGSYTMGTTVEMLSLQMPTTANCGILTVGVGQGCELKHLKLHGVSNIGISITDTFGNIGFKASDIFILGGAGVLSATSVGIHSAAQSVIEWERISVEGVADSANNRFKRAMEITSGGNLVKNLHFEACQTGADIDAAVVHSQKFLGITNTGLVCAGAKGIWIHAGFAGSVQAENVACGAGGIILQNDNTGYARAGAGTLPSYTSTATIADASIHENVILSGVKADITYVSGGTMTPDVSVGSSHRINVTTVNAFTIAAPTYGSAAMPATLIGRRISIMIRNGGAGVMGVITWNAVFKMSAWTNPANNFSRAIDFEWNSAQWIQVGQTGVDIPN